MKHEYRELMGSVRVPEELNERVLEAARQPDRETRTGRRPVWRLAVCAVLAVALVLGGVSLRPEGGEAERRDDTEVLELPQRLTCSFGLTAYAADTIPAANGNLVLGGGTADGDVILTTTELRPEREQYTNYRFQVHGEQIERLTLSMDRGGLYRVKGGQSLMSVLENPAEEVYDPEAVYGLWVPPQEFLQGRGRAILNGALLTVTAHFADGSEQTNSYRLTAQRLLVSRNEDGTELLVPALEGSEGGVSGLYLEALNSVWFRWPVEGANTISLSNRYGYRAAPGGEGGIFHAGIDIGAAHGTDILASADGVVIVSGVVGLCVPAGIIAPQPPPQRRE